jgi:NAD(P)-dependent dehydrogenase (short-subunit alcohol dehydrogenase family)
LPAATSQGTYGRVVAGITAHAILAGGTDTPALRQLPEYQKLIEIPRQRNPHHRLTMPEDVAHYIAALCHPATYWMTGNTIHVDGGENVVGSAGTIVLCPPMNFRASINSKRRRTSCVA